MPEEELGHVGEHGLELLVVDDEVAAGQGDELARCTTERSATFSRVSPAYPAASSSSWVAAGTAARVRAVRPPGRTAPVARGFTPMGRPSLWVTSHGNANFFALTAPVPGVPQERDVASICGEESRAPPIRGQRSQRSGPNTS